MKQNLISYSKVTNKNKIVFFGNYSKIYDQYQQLIEIARKDVNLYHLTSFVFENQNKEISASVAKNDGMTLKGRWHRILEDVNFQYLSKICQNESLIGLFKNLERDFIECTICIESKMSNLPVESNREKAKDILKIVHIDLNGPHSEGFCGEKYFLTFVDDYSELARVYPIKLLPKQ